MKSLFQFLFVAVPKVLGGICTLGVNIVLLRCFGPEQFGMYSLCITAILMSDAIVGSAMDMAVVRLAPLYRGSEPKKAAAIQRAAFRLKIAAVGIVLSIVLVAGNTLSRTIFHQPNQAFLLVLSCLAAMAMLSLRSLQAWLQIEGRFGLYGALDLLHMGLKFGGVAALLLVGVASPGRVLLIFMLGPAIAFAALVFQVARPLVSLGTEQTRSYRELLSLAGWFTATFALTSVVGRLDMIVLSAWSDLRNVGIFAGGQAFAMIPEMLGSYLSIVLGPRVIPCCKQGQFGRLFYRFQSAIVIAALTLLVVVLLSFNRMSAYILPPSFSQSAQVFLVLLPGALAALVSFPLTYTLLMFARPRFLFLMDACTAPILLIVYCWVVPAHGAVGAALVTSASRVGKAGIAQAVAWWTVKNEEHLKLRILASRREHRDIIVNPLIEAEGGA
jgi:O-antigen/teichoic acid export membrane protein